MLLDAMLAFTLGTILCLASFSVLMGSASANNAFSQNVLAYNAARQVVENLRGYRSFTNNPISNGTYNGTQFGPVPQIAQMNGGATSVTISTSKAYLRQAVVTVTWTSGRPAITHTRRLVALFAPGGVTP